MARVMDNLHTGIVAPQLYRPDQMSYWEQQLSRETDLFEQRHQGVYLGFATLRQVGRAACRGGPPRPGAPCGACAASSRCRLASAAPAVLEALAVLKPAARSWRTSMGWAVCGMRTACRRSTW